MYVFVPRKLLNAWSNFNLIWYTYDLKYLNSNCGGETFINVGLVSWLHVNVIGKRQR